MYSIILFSIPVGYQTGLELLNLGHPGRTLTAIREMRRNQGVMLFNNCVRTLRRDYIEGEGGGGRGKGEEGGPTYDQVRPRESRYRPYTRAAVFRKFTSFFRDISVGGSVILFLVL